MINKQFINDFTLNELSEMCIENNIPKFRAIQFFQWIHGKGVNDIEEIKNVPKDIRDKLTQKYSLLKGKIIEKKISQWDGTSKYLISLDDGNIVESVIMKYEHGISACISSQVGCRMGCSFCASTIGGLVRNMTAGEIELQLHLMQRDIGQRISNIVMMGSGEPLDNFENVIDFLNIVNDTHGLKIGYRHITLSTCGVVPNIYRLADFKIPITLALSLHSTDNLSRSDIMPINRKYSIKETIDACRYFAEVTKRRVTFEYALIKGINDSQQHAHQLSNLLRGGLFHVNLIPINKVSESGFEKPSISTISEFKKILMKNGIETTQRREMGADINAACGQLRKSFIEESRQ